MDLYVLTYKATNCSVHYTSIPSHHLGVQETAVDEKVYEAQMLNKSGLYIFMIMKIKLCFNYIIAQ